MVFCFLIAFQYQINMLITHFMKSGNFAKPGWVYPEIAPKSFRTRVGFTFWRFLRFFVVRLDFITKSLHNLDN